MNIMNDYIKQLEKRIEELEETLQELEHADSIISVLSSEKSICCFLNGYLAANCVIEGPDKVRVKFAKQCYVNMREYQKLKRSFDYFEIDYKETESNPYEEPPF